MKIWRESNEPTYCYACGSQAIESYPQSDVWVCWECEDCGNEWAVVPDEDYGSHPAFSN